MKVLLVLVIYLHLSYAAQCTTNWAQISSKLPGSFALPMVPSAPLPNSDPGIKDGYEFTYAGTANGQTGPDTTCNIVNGWNNTLVSMGPLKPHSDGTSHCRVKAESNWLKFYNKYPIGYNFNVSNDPTWVSMRFPVAPNQEPVQITFKSGYSYLYGGNPVNCSTGPCVRYVISGWDDDVKAGLYLLWGNPSDSSECSGGQAGWFITGPHEPFGNPDYIGSRTFTVPVPEAFKKDTELVVSFFVFNQYSGGCVGTKCTDARAQAVNLYLDQVTFKSIKKLSLVIPRPPFNGRPRMFASYQGDPLWNEAGIKFDQLNCSNLALEQWGNIPNFKNYWDKITLDGSQCQNTVPTDISKLDFTKDYFTSGTGGTKEKDRKTVHLLRRLKDCYGFYNNITLYPSATCKFSLASLKLLQTTFINAMLTFLPSEKWVGEPSWGFDLSSEPPYRFWPLFIDTLWGDLTDTQRNSVFNAMSPNINKFLENARARFWTLENGNNWTPTLCSGALSWAIALYHEDNRAEEVIRICMEKMWLHAPYYEPDGVYHEGLSYTVHAIKPVFYIQKLLKINFGRNLDSHPWPYMTNWAKWMIDSMLPDGYTTNIGDAHMEHGLPLYTLYGLYWDELLNKTLYPSSAPAVPPCTLWKYWANKYFAGMSDPWDIQPFIARNWTQINAACPFPPDWNKNGTLTYLKKEVKYITNNRYLWSSQRQFRVTRPGTTETAKKTFPELRFKQVDQITISTSAIPASWPHMDFDFSQILWTVYGSRLLCDFGYGQISNAGIKYTLIDHTPLTHNVLNIPEALFNNISGSSTANVDYSKGSIKLFVTPGNMQCFDLDGSYPYGRNTPLSDPVTGNYGGSESTAYGDMHRYICNLGDGSTDFLVIDSFVVRADRPAIRAENYFHSPAMVPPPPVCRYDRMHVPMVQIGTNKIRLNATCNSMYSSAVWAEAAGTITAASLKPGQLTVDTNITAFTDISQTTTYYYRSRFIPTNPIRSDVRAFLLRGSTSIASLPSSSLSLVSCGTGKTCFDAVLGGGVTVRAVLTAQGTGSDPFYSLSDVYSVVGGNPSSSSSSSTTTTKASTSGTLNDSSSDVSHASSDSSDPTDSPSSSSTTDSSSSSTSSSPTSTGTPDDKLENGANNVVVSILFFASLLLFMF